MTTVNSDKSLEEVISLLRQSYAEYKYLDIEIKVKGKARSGQQRKALQVYCQKMAEKLNDAGIDHAEWECYLRDRGLETHWTEDSFKGLFKSYAGYLYPEIINKKGEPKTSKLKRDQMTKVYELVNMRISTLWGCGMQWPSNER